MYLNAPQSEDEVILILKHNLMLSSSIRGKNH